MLLQSPEKLVNASRWVIWLLPHIHSTGGFERSLTRSRRRQILLQSDGDFFGAKTQMNENLYGSSEIIINGGGRDPRGDISTTSTWSLKRTSLGLAMTLGLYYSKNSGRDRILGSRPHGSYPAGSNTGRRGAAGRATERTTVWDS